MMANVTKCDKCGKVVKHEESVDITIRKRNFEGRTDGVINTAEVCRECYNDICTLLGLKVKK